MNKGIYIALSGALLKQKHMDTFAQNMANASTNGYKKERISFKEYLVPVDNKKTDMKDARAMSQISDVVTDYSNGSLTETGNPLDVAIHGKGFFALENNKYTRNGAFMIDGEGNLVTQGGLKVLGSGGPITVTGTNLDINEDGEIFVDGVSVARLNIVDFDDKGVLVKLDGGTFSTEEQGRPADSKVSQGYLEASNVDVVREMVQMLNALREFETYQKVIQSFDDASSKTINELGK